MLKKDDLNIIFSKENLITSIKDKISTKYEIKKNIRQRCIWKSISSEK